MKKKQQKTNAVRILDKHNISYDLKYYKINETDLSGMTVAMKIGYPPEQVFKTLLVHGVRHGFMLACIPTDSELDLKALAQAANDKKVDMVPVKDIKKLTGYIRGGVSPVGTLKSYPVYLDASAFDHPVISLSAGTRGCQMLINPNDLSDIISIETAAIARKS